MTPFNQNNQTEQYKGSENPTTRRLFELHQAAEVIDSLHFETTNQVPVTTQKPSGDMSPTSLRLITTNQVPPESKQSTKPEEPNIVSDENHDDPKLSISDQIENFRQELEDIYGQAA